MSTRFPAALIAAQIGGILRAWGMSEAHIAPTLKVMLEADLRGIDSHGLTMMQLYSDQLRAGKLNMRPEIRVLRETAVSALIDGGGGLGHAPSVMAMELAISKAGESGMAAVSVRNSNHYGAAGVYASMASAAGLIGISTTAVFSASVVPTFARPPMFGTNPIAFSAPARRNRAFLLDMATSTVAIGKLKVAAMHRKPIPSGWALDDRGRPLNDPFEALKYRRMTPLGGAREMGGHKGYGLAAMVEILSTMLGGASYAPTRPRDAPTLNVGHFFLTLDPGLFREREEFMADLDDMLDALHAAPPVDPDQPVLVHGDPEAQCAAERSAHGIPLQPDQIELMRTLAQASGAAFVLVS